MMTHHYTYHCAETYVPEEHEAIIFTPANNLSDISTIQRPNLRERYDVITNLKNTEIYF